MPETNCKSSINEISESLTYTLSMKDYPKSKRHFSLSLESKYLYNIRYGKRAVDSKCLGLNSSKATFFPSNLGINCFISLYFIYLIYKVGIIVLASLQSWCNYYTEMLHIKNLAQCLFRTQ